VSISHSQTCFGDRKRKRSLGDNFINAVRLVLRVILCLTFNRHGERLHGKFVVTLDGRKLCIFRQPLLDARVLITEGVPPETPIATRHAGADFDAMTSTVETAAKWTVKENEIQSPHFVHWEAFPASQVQLSMRQNERPVHDAVLDAERIHDANGGAA
jgi:hypothetical protein